MRGGAGRCGEVRGGVGDGHGEGVGAEAHVIQSSMECQMHELKVVIILARAALVRACVCASVGRAGRECGERGHAG